jgi:hypothetical protein
LCLNFRSPLISDNSYIHVKGQQCINASISSSYCNPKMLFGPLVQVFLMEVTVAQACRDANIMLRSLAAKPCNNLSICDRNSCRFRTAFAECKTRNKKNNYIATNQCVADATNGGWQTQGNCDAWSWYVKMGC